MLYIYIYIYTHIYIYICIYIHIVDNTFLHDQNISLLKERPSEFMQNSFTMVKEPKSKCMWIYVVFLKRTILKFSHTFKFVFLADAKYLFLFYLISSLIYFIFSKYWKFIKNLPQHIFMQLYRNNANAKLLKYAIIFDSLSKLIYMKTSNN